MSKGYRDMFSLDPRKKAIIGIATIAIIFVFGLVFVGIENHWFERDNTYFTILDDADGLRKGTPITLSGLKIGKISSVTVDDENKILVRLKISRRYRNKLKKDSLARVVRALVIGDKKIDIVPGTKDSPELKNNEFIQGQDSFEIMDLISGKKFSKFFKKFDGVQDGINNLILISSKLLQVMKPEDVDKMYSLMTTGMENLNTLLKELNIIFVDMGGRKKVIPKLAKSALRTVNYVNRDFLRNGLAKNVITDIGKIADPLASKSHLAENTIENLNLLIKEFAKNPKIAKQLVNTLKEATITLKALQKTWILSDHVEKVKKGK